MPSRKKSNRRKYRRRSPRRSLRFNPKLSINLPKMVIKERVDTIENLIDTVISPGANRVPRDVANIIGEYDNYDDGSKRRYWKNQILDLDAYKRGEGTGRDNNPYMMYEITIDNNGLIHHKEWYENGSKRTDCFYYFNRFSGEKLFHGDCKHWNENGFLVYDRTFKNGEEKLMSKIKGKGKKIDFYYKIEEEDDE